MSDAGSRESILTPQVVALLLAGVAYFTVAGISFPVLPRLVERELGGGDGEIGLTFGVMALGMLLTRPFVGYIADRFGRRPTMIVGATAIAALQLLHVPAARLGLGALLAVRFLVGAAGSAMYLGQATTATELPPRDRSGEIFATFSVAVFVGFAIGPVVGEMTLEAAGFTATFVLAAAVGAVCAVVGALLPETRPDGVRPSLEGLGSLFHPVAARAGTVSLLIFGIFIGFTAFVTPYAESLGLDQARWVLLTFAGTSLVTRALGGRLIDSANRLNLGTMAQCSMAAGVGLIVLFDAVWSLYVGAAVMAVGHAFNVPLMVVAAADSAPPAQRSKVVATVVVFGDLANSLGAFGLGYVADAIGYRGMYSVVMVLALGAVVVFRSPFLYPVTGLRSRPVRA